MRDEKSRNAYKRFWRNRKNYLKHWDERLAATAAMNRSLHLMVQADKDIIAQNNSTKEHSK